MSLSAKVSPKIQKVINRFPTKCKIYSRETNIFGEPEDLKLKLEVIGFYHEDTKSTSLSIQNSGVVYDRQRSSYLMILINEDTDKIAKNDLLFTGTQGYQVIDVLNPNKLDIYYDVQIQEVKTPCPD